MPMFFDKSGQRCSAFDPDRMMFLGRCGYWTDDMGLLLLDDILILNCPTCGAVGITQTMGDLLDNVLEAEYNGAMLYGDFVADVKETCLPLGWLESFRAYNEYHKTKSLCLN